MITDKGRPLRFLLVILFIIYLVFVPVWVIFFKAEANVLFVDYWKYKDYADLDMLVHIADHFNFNPFNIIVGDMILNVIGFVPFGIYLEMLFREKSALTKIMSVTAVSLAIEIAQFSLMLGKPDIVDLIANTLGGVIGIVIMHKLHSDKVVKGILIIALVLTVITMVSVVVQTIDQYYDLAPTYSAEKYEGYLKEVQDLTDDVAAAVTGPLNKVGFEE